ncbi:hypothetical protein COCNU_scaffold003753G000010 [Cocos nucifera]|nr:hypothetical protein [Cocos nucifera]
MEKLLHPSESEQISELYTVDNGQSGIGEMIRGTVYFTVGFGAVQWIRSK